MLNEEQTHEDVYNKFNEWYDFQFSQNHPILNLDVGEMSPTEIKPTLHHCFLTEKEAEERGFGTEIYNDLFAECAEDWIEWNHTSETILGCRINMLRNLYRLNGVAIFIGKLEGGVKEEYDIAMSYHMSIVHIP